MPHFFARAADEARLSHRQPRDHYPVVPFDFTQKYLLVCRRTIGVRHGKAQNRRVNPRLTPPERFGKTEDRGRVKTPAHRHRHWISTANPAPDRALELLAKSFCVLRERLQAQLPRGIEIPV